MSEAKLRLSSLYGSMALDPGQWGPGDRPALNTWYPCKRKDDYYKIILQQHRTEIYGPLYRVVSMRGADIGFDLTLALARNIICTETRRTTQ